MWGSTELETRQCSVWDLLSILASVEVAWGCVSPLTSVGLLCFAAPVDLLDQRYLCLPWRVKIPCFHALWPARSVSWLEDAFVGILRSQHSCKEMFCHVNNSRGVQGRVGCCKWEAWVSLVEAAHIVTTAPLSQDNLFDWLTIQMESWIRLCDDISLQVCTTDLLRPQPTHLTQAVTVPLYWFGRTRTIPAWTFKSLLVQGVTIKEIICSNDRKALTVDWGLNGFSSLNTA